MTTPPVTSVTDELIAELDWVAGSNPDLAVSVRCSSLRALLAERAELKRDAERYRLFAETVVAECSRAVMTPQQRALFGCMNGVTSVTIDELAAMFDAAMQEAKP